MVTRSRASTDTSAADDPPAAAATLARLRARIWTSRARNNGGVPTVVARGRRRSRSTTGWWPYRADGATADGVEADLELTAVPYFVWGNRDEGAMRVWVPAE